MSIDQTVSSVNSKINETPDTLGGFVALKRKSERALPELLAPAGSPKALRAAIAAGADAVYFALPEFNARINADNFTRESFAESVELCHKHGVKAYITLNTQIYDRERKDFIESAFFAYKSGVDAAIVGDLGCAALIKKHIPDMELHASTQLSGHNSAAGEELARLGFTRMVCAREMSLGDIKSFTANAPVEAEIFVHGALCVCHSGQCLFSSLVGGRSGNRGLCAQPCRLPYGKEGEKGSGYHLSLKDMCLASYIPEIIDSGVASLKIEGRMKGADYVFGVVSIYRRLLDERRAATEGELSELAAIFSRGGFTDGYFKGEISHKMLGVRSDKDKEMSRAATDGSADAELRRIGLILDVKILKNKPMRLRLTTDAKSSEKLGRIIEIEVEGGAPLIAESRPTDADAAKKNLVKFGATPFAVTDFNIEIDDGLMVPVSLLNSLRRQGSEMMEAELLKPYNTRADAILELEKISVALNEKGKKNCTATSTELCERDAEKTPMRRTAFFMREDSIPEDASEYFDAIFLSMTEFVEANKERISALGINGIALPPVIFDSEMGAVDGCLKVASEMGVKFALVGNLGHLSIVNKYGFSPVGDFRLNVSNSETARLLTERHPFSHVILSPELSLPRIRTISEVAPVGAIVYGRVPLMIVEKCVISELYPCGYAKNGGAPCKTCATDSARLVDRTGASFPVMREFYHRNVIFNSLPTYVADKQRELPEEERLTRHFIFSCETREEVKEVIDSYKNCTPASSRVRRLGV